MFFVFFKINKIVFAIPQEKSRHDEINKQVNKSGTKAFTTQSGVDNISGKSSIKIGRSK